MSFANSFVFPAVLPAVIFRVHLGNEIQRESVYAHRFLILFAGIPHPLKLAFVVILAFPITNPFAFLVLFHLWTEWFKNTLVYRSLRMHSLEDTVEPRNNSLAFKGSPSIKVNILKSQMVVFNVISPLFKGYPEIKVKNLQSQWDR